MNHLPNRRTTVSTATMSREPFNRLVKLKARAFYDDVTLRGENQPKSGRSDNRGMAVVILDALTKYQWVREEDLAKILKLHTKQLRRTLRFFEEEKLVARDSRKETAKRAKFYNAAIATTGDGQQVVREGEEKLKLHTHSYCCLDYAQIFDVVRYRIHRMKKQLKDQLEDRNTIQEYSCPNCKRRYSALDALQLVSPEDDYFHCENCKSVLVTESDKLAAEEIGDGDDNVRRRRRENLKDQVQRIEDQFKPLMEQLARVKDLPVPEFLNFQAWEALAAVRVENGESGPNDPSKPSQGQLYGISMPFPGDTKVEVDLIGNKDEDTKPDPSTNGPKVLPPWMIKQGMVLSKEQLGDVKQESKDSSSSTGVITEDKKVKVDVEDDDKRRNEYYKAYYAALLKLQQEQEEATTNNSTNIEDGAFDQSLDRKVGGKAKREEEDFEWEVATPADNVNTTHKVNDLNLQAEPSENEDDDIDWEEG